MEPWGTPRVIDVQFERELMFEDWFMICTFCYILKEEENFVDLFTLLSGLR
jgi:hypothetical protein